jgi:osmotically-inducible protein OsmY
MKKGYFALFTILMISVLFTENASQKAFSKTNLIQASNISASAGLNERKNGLHFSDNQITSYVKNLILADPSIDGGRIDVMTKQKVVYLMGEVPDHRTLIKATQLAHEAKSVRAVVNMLRVQR